MAETARAPLTLKIITPDGERPEISCDSVSVTVKDNKNGKGGGSYGIKKGHAEALIALDKGTLSAKKGEETIFSENLPEGFLSIKNNYITVIT